MAFDSHPARRPYPSGCWKRPTDTTTEDHWNLSPFGNESRIDRLMLFKSEACLADSGVIRPLRSSPRRHSELPLAPPSSLPNSVASCCAIRSGWKHTCPGAPAARAEPAAP